MTLTFQEKYAITDKEKEAIIQLVAERYRNYVYTEAENTVRGMVNKICGRIYGQYYVKNEDTLTVTFTVSQMVADVLVCLGEYRRKLEQK